MNNPIYSNPSSGQKNNIANILVETFLKHLSQGHSLDGSTQIAINKNYKIKHDAVVVPAGIERSIEHFSEQNFKDSRTQINKDISDLYDTLIKHDEIKDNQKLKDKLEQLKIRFQSSAKEPDELMDKKKDLDEQNRNQLMARFLTTLILPGVLEVTEILFALLDNFGGSVPDGIGNSLKDSKVFSFMAKVNEAFKVDEIGKAFAKFPIFSDVNDLISETAKSEYFSPFAKIGHELIGSDLSSIAVKSSLVAHRVSQEYPLYTESLKLNEKLDGKFQDLQAKNNKILEESIKALQDYEIKKIDTFLDLADIKCLFDSKNQTEQKTDTAGSNLVFAFENLNKDKYNKISELKFKLQGTDPNGKLLEIEKSMQDMTLDDFKKMDLSKNLESYKKLSAYAQDWVEAEKAKGDASEFKDKLQENKEQKTNFLQRYQDLIDKEKDISSFSQVKPDITSPEGINTLKDEYRSFVRDTVLENIYKARVGEQEQKGAVDSVAFVDPATKDKDPKIEGISPNVEKSLKGWAQRARDRVANQNASCVSII
jgi:hypothetical protein